MVTKRKMRKFVDGGFSTVEGKNKMIDDDVRARALRSVMPDDSPAGTTEYGEQNELPEIKAATKTTSKTTSKTPTKAPPAPAEEKARIEAIGKKQGLERVEPESFIPGGGLLKMGLKAITGASARKAAKQLDNKAVKMLENKPTRMLSYDKAGAKSKTRTERAAAREEAMKRSNARNYGIDPDAPGSASALESLRRNIGSGEFAMKKGGAVSKADMQKAGFYDKGRTKSERQNIVKKVTTKPQRVAIVEKAFSTKNMKSGGMASKRADGCAVRGKTRA